MILGIGLGVSDTVLYTVEFLVTTRPKHVRSKHLFLELDV
jgi:hypothetical protein